MSQITVLTKLHRVVDAFIVSTTLFDALDTIARDNNLSDFELPMLQLINHNFLTAFADKHHETIKRLQAQPQNCQEPEQAVVSFAVAASSWYGDFLSFLDAIAKLPQADSLYISLTSR